MTLTIGLALSCTSQEAESLSNIKRVSNQEWKTLIAQEKEPQLIDVRTPKEFNAGHLDGSVNIDFRAENFLENMMGLDKDRTLYIYCHSGGRSGKALELLYNKGFEGIIELREGYSNWE